jgi:tetratricopeptide (TPR) repeat protein
MNRWFAVVASLALGAATPFAQTTARDQLARGRAAWDQRLTNTAIAALQEATSDPATAAEAHELLGIIYAFRGWQQDNVFPGFHDEPAYREKAIAELRAAAKADPNRPTARQALQIAEAFAEADRVEPMGSRPAIRLLDARIEEGRRQKASIADLVEAIEARIKAQADPAPYFTGAQILIDRGEYDRAIALAERGVGASERFIRENLSAYQMEGKSQGAAMRSRAQAADLVGWALFQKKDYGVAAARLEEAERLYRGQDFANQFHLAEVARARNEPDRARDRYLNALSLSTGPAPLRQSATEALTAIVSASREPPANFDAWLEEQLARRRDARRASDLKSLLDKRLPTLTLTTVDGHPYDTSGLRGKVLLLNFFASW